MVFPRFFATCRSKATILLSRSGRRRLSELPSDAKPMKPLSPKGEYVELKDQGHKASVQAPYAGLGSSFITNSTKHSENLESDPLDYTQSGNEAGGGKLIWKTVQVSQSARHV